MSGGSVTTERSQNDLTRDGAINHILVVAYLYPPCNDVSAHRPAGLQRAFASAGIRTTVLSSEISGAYDDDGARGIIRAGDLRTRFQTQYQTLVGYREVKLEAHARPRWWTKYIVPDPTAISWFPQALMQLLRLIRIDRPDVILTTSGPESAHLLGLVASMFGVSWVADYRDPWLRDAQHPALLRMAGRVLERWIAKRATILTAVNVPIASEITRRNHVDAHTVSNGFDRAVLAGAVDERATLASARFSLVHTGLLGIDADEPVLHRGRDAQTFLDAVSLLLDKSPELAEQLELVVAGRISGGEREVLMRGNLGKVVRVLGLLPRTRALGLQQAADGLLLIPGAADATTAKVFEYLAARKPIFAVTGNGSVAAELLREAGKHTVVEPCDADSIAGAFRDYLARWSVGAAPYDPHPEFDLEAYEYENLGRKVLRLIADARADRAT